MSPILRTALIALGPALGLGIARFAYGLMLPPMKTDLGWTFAQAGWMNTINAIGYIGGALTAGRLTAALGSAELYRVGAGVTIIAVLLLGLSKDASLLSLCRFLSGLGGAWIFVAGGTIVNSMSPVADLRQGLLLGIYYAGAGFGIAISAAMVTGLFLVLGDDAWQKVWLLLGVLCALLALLSFTALETSVLSIATSHPEPYRATSSACILIGYAAFGAGSIGYMTYMFANLQHSGSPPWLLATFWGTIGLAAMAGPWLWPGLIAHATRGRAFAFLAAINAAGSAIPIWTTYPAALIASAALFGSVFFATVAATTAFIRRNVEPQAHAAAIGIFTASFGIGQALGPIVLGWVADRTGALQYGLMAGSMLTLMGAVTALGQRDGRPPSKANAMTLRG